MSHTFREFPKMMFHRQTGVAKIIHDPDQEAALGPAWDDHRHQSPAPAVPPAAPPTAPGQCQSCVRLAGELMEMKTKFDVSWLAREEEYRRDYAVLQEQYNQLFTDHCALKQQIEQQAGESNQAVAPEAELEAEAPEAPRRRRAAK